MRRDGDPTLATKHLNIKIREMEIDDIPKVFHLGEKLFEAEKVPNLYRTWDEYEVIELFHSDSENCLVAEKGEKVIGFILGTTISKRHSAWKYGHLVWLGIDPSFQRSGIGERLLNRFMTLMLKNRVRILMVDTEAENLSALQFFRKVGFGNPQNHIYLTMNLASKKRLLKNKRS